MPTKIQLDEEGLKACLEAILEEINAIEDPEELNAYRAIFRKHVPLFRRAYVAGWLLARHKPGQLPARASTNRRRNQTEKPAERQSVERPGNDKASDKNAEKAAAPSRDDVTSIFIGIGKSRKVFPRDIMALITEQGGLDKSQIGTIKILDNYSFVEVANDQCNALIEKLNNIEYRGRTVAVNFAKKRD